jgi:hypothetical protein
VSRATKAAKKARKQTVRHPRSEHTIRPASAQPTSARSTAAPKTTPAVHRTTSQPVKKAQATHGTAGLPAGFADWTLRHQWRWLKRSGQHLSFGQWKAAVRQAGSSASASTHVLTTPPQSRGHHHKHRGAHRR